MPRRRKGIKRPATSRSSSHPPRVQPPKKRMKMASSQEDNLEEALSKLAAPRRLRRELNDIKSCSSATYARVEPNEENILVWTGLLLPSSEPYKSGAFLVEITFPHEFPFRPPKLEFKTQIYHPNVSEAGQVCLPLITPDQWKPTMKIDQVLRAAVDLIDTPKPEDALRADIAREYNDNPEQYLDKAKKFTAKYAVRRPDGGS